MRAGRCTADNLAELNPSLFRCETQPCSNSEGQCLRAIMMHNNHFPPLSPTCFLPQLHLRYLYCTLDKYHVS